MEKYRFSFFFIILIIIISNSAISIELLKKYPATGYDSYSKEYKKNCLFQDFNTLIYIGQNTSEVKYIFKNTHEHSSYNILSNSEEKGNIKIVSGESKTIINNSRNSDRANIILIYQNKLIGKTAIVDDPKVTQLGAYASKLTPFEKRKYCGDKFISSIHLGANFYIKIKLFFKNIKLKRKFKSEISLNLFWFNFKNNYYDKNLEIFKNDVILFVSSKQLGGNIEKYNYILSQIGNSISCPINILTSCQNYFQKIIKYEHEDFMQQLNDLKYSEDSKNGLIPISYEFSHYSSLGFPDLDTQIDIDFTKDNESKNALNEIQNLLKNELNNKERAETLLNNFNLFLLHKEQVNNIKLTYEKIKYNLTQLKYAKKQCLFEIVFCPQLKNNAFQNLVSYPRNSLFPK